MKYVLYVAAILIVLGLLGWGIKALSGLGANQKEQPIQTTKAERRDIAETITASGEIVPAQRAEVKSEVSGRIAKLLVKDGEAVAQNQLLLELDRSELLSQKEELSRAIESAELRAEKAQRDFKRIQGLFQQEFASEKDFQDADTELKLSRNDLEIQRQRLQPLDEKLANTTIRAPQAGVVLNCDLHEGEVIVGAGSMAQSTVIMEVADLSRLLVKTDINEVDVVRLTNGLGVSVTFDSVPGVTVPGVVSSISPAAEVKDKTRGGPRTFPVEVTCDAVDSRIKPGISANVSVPLSRATGVVAVVVSAVFSESTNKVAFLKTGKAFEKTPVTIGINDAQYVEVRTGLKEGDEVALVRPPGFEKPAEEQSWKNPKGRPRPPRR